MKGSVKAVADGDKRACSTNLIAGGMGQQVRDAWERVGLRRNCFATSHPWALHWSCGYVAGHGLNQYSRLTGFPGSIASRMPVPIPDFLNLLVASRLMAASSVPKLQEQFSQVKGADTQGNSTTLAQWLISQGILSKYQAKVLLAGHAGPFMYGEYTVYDRVSSGRLQGVFRAIHPPTRVRVTLSFH